MSDEEKTAMVCARVDAVLCPVPGSLKTNCTHCQVPLWISPASLEIAHEEGADTICFACAAIELDNPELEIRNPTPAQVKEMLDVLEARRHEPS